MVLTLEKGMGRQFAREWYNTNRALLIAEHQRKTDAKRTKIDRYMEQVFQCADPAVVDDATGRNVQMTLTELFMMKCHAGLDKNDDDDDDEEEEKKEEVEEKKTEEAARVVLTEVNAAATATTTTSAKRDVAPLLSTTSAVPEEDSELDLALEFLHDMGGCMYVTTVHATKSMVPTTRISL